MPSNMCTATKPLSRPAAVLSSASSAATVRTSIGNGTAKPSRSISSSTAAHGLGGALARQRVLHLGEAHEPRAGEDRGRAVHRASSCPASRVTSRLSCGIRRGSAAPGAAEQPEGVVGEQRRRWRTRSRGRAGAAASSVRLFVRVSAMSACGNTKNSKWSLPSASSSKRVERLGQRRGLVDAAQRERRHAAQRDLGDHARARRGRRARRGTPPARARREHASVEPSASTSVSAGDLRGDVAQPRAGAVRGGRDRAGDALHVDVAEVLHRQAVARRARALSSWIVMPGLHASPARWRGRRRARGACRSSRSSSAVGAARRR